MKQPNGMLSFAACAAMALCGFPSQAQDTRELRVPHAECAYFGPRRAEFDKSSLSAQRRRIYEFSRNAIAVASHLPPLPAKDKGPQKSRNGAADSDNIIDRHLTQVWQEKGITPALKTNDFEFVRRVTLDLTGRIPTAVRTQAFLNDLNPDKRARLVDELLASEAWVDKWTMFFGDLYKNTLITTQFRRFAEGRTVFYQYINKALAENKPYDKIATELLTASGANSWTQGDINYVVGGFVTGGPVQDRWDQMAVNASEAFLGISHLNCIMCHDGRRHLEPLSVWAKTATRFQAYSMSAFFSRTDLLRVPHEQPGVYHWSLLDNTRYTGNYGLNTSTGNRPARTPVGTVRQVTPEYVFGGGTPRPGENYRAAFAREITGDFQFARAAVNYIWKQFMTKGFVEPVNQFDPGRLDPDNPPEEPWEIQPNQPRLLNALAQDFIDAKYNLKSLMRNIVLSETYQLSSRYDGQWQGAWENTYARHLPRRLWAEEMADAITLASNIPQTYDVPILGSVNWAMKLPDIGLPAGAMRTWLDSFYRGNRDTDPRLTEGSTLQALNLMNDSFVMSRTRVSGSGATASLLSRAISGTDEQLVNTLFINVLSRYPNDAEKKGAMAALAGGGNRQQKASDLLWSLYNKVDFLFNY